MNISQFCESIRGWANRHDLTDDTITYWVRLAEQDLSAKMRVGEMITIARSTVSLNRVTLPYDWEQTDFLCRVAGGVFRYKPRDIFYRLDENNENCYTTSGRYITFGGDVEDGEEVEIHYFASLPALGNTPNYMTTKYLKILTFTVQAYSNVFQLDDERAVAAQALIAQDIATVNDNYTVSKGAGSLLVRSKPRAKGFG